MVKKEKQLYALSQECEDLMTKGITGNGEGFDLPGRRLGGFSRQPPVSSLRQTVLAAAQKRARLGSLLPSGPKRLGGDSSIMVALSPIQAAAMAAERRLQDDIWCGSESYEVSGEGEIHSDLLETPVYVGHQAGKSRVPDGFDTQSADAISRKRRHESIDSSLSESSNSWPESTFVDLNKVASVPQKNCQTESKSLSQAFSGHPNSSFADLSMDASSSSGSMLNHNAPHGTEESAMWECATCTLLNPHLAPICKLCSTLKPKDIEVKFKIWSCKFCTLENSVKSEKCTACGQWRYSHGPPVATPGPNIGT
ncbi:hypothetical protein U1Q18_000301 [Sarracenia purpurea var. burkii]